MLLSIVLITFNEEENLPRTLKSVEGLVRDLGGEIIVVDSGSTDRTVEIAKSFGARVFVEEWKGFAAQKNSAIEKASGDWVLLLDADEEVEPQLASEIVEQLRLDEEVRVDLGRDPNCNGLFVPRKNLFLGRWIKHGGFWPDLKLRLFRGGTGRVEDRVVHETIKVNGATANLQGALIHHAYSTLSSYIEHMNRYSSLGAEMLAGETPAPAVAPALESRAQQHSVAEPLQKKTPRGFSFIDIFIRPRLTFFYNYFLRLGFLDGREGFLLHLYHAAYVSWKYAKAWELSRKK